VAEPSKETAAGAEGMYGSFDAFLKQAIREYYDRSWTTRKGNFIALLIASGQTSPCASVSATPWAGPSAWF
jgi:hypothetical protein